MQVKDILGAKPRAVVTVRPYDKIGALTDRLHGEKIGAAVVTGDDDTIAGIISERDIVRGLSKHGTALLEMNVEALMTSRVKTCSPSDSIKDVMQMMTLNRFRHVPVVEDERLVGIISVGDVVKFRLDEMTMEASVLRDYAVARR